MFFKINSNCYIDKETKLSWEPKSFQQLSFQGAHIYIFLFLLFNFFTNFLNLWNCDSFFFSLEILCNFEIHRYGTPDSVKPNLNRRFCCNKTILSCLMGMLFSLLHRCFLINHQSFQHTNPTGIILVPLLKQSRMSKITCTIEKFVTCRAGSQIRISKCLCTVRIEVIGNL